MKSALWISFILLANAVFASAADRPYSGIVVFGGSLSDSGNLFALTGGLNLPPAYDVDTLLIPSSAYARGGHYFTNGEPWIVRLGRSLALATSVQPAFRDHSAPAAADYAVAGARAG